jgi:circadian clock protein KaiC
VNAARRGEPGLFVTFGETPAQVLANGAGFGWEMAALQNDKLTVIEADLRPGSTLDSGLDLSGLLADIQTAAAKTGARRIVFDAFHLLLSLLDDSSAEWQEVFRLREWLREQGFTAILTADLENRDARTVQRLAFLQSVADCTVFLKAQAGLAQGSRSVCIVKYRGSSFLEGYFPMIIGGSGIEVTPTQPAAPAPGAAGNASSHPEIELAKEELNARVQALDRLLEMKQAELNFLLERRHRDSAKPPGNRLRFGRRPNRRPPPPGGGRMTNE